MPKLSPEELQEARRRRAEERAREEEEQERKEREREDEWEQSQSRLQESKEGYDRLHSAVHALYEDIDKLARKWPREPVTQLTLDKTNKAIREVKTLLEDEENPFVEDLSEMVPAGDLPETRDVLIMLGQLKAALSWYRDKYWQKWIHL